MRIAFTHNLQMSSSEAEAEFDTPHTVQAITQALSSLGHAVEPIEVSGPPSRVVSRLEALTPDLVFNTAEGFSGRYREAFYPGIFEQLDLPYTGSDAYVCTLTLDKNLTKAMLKSSGIPLAGSRFVRSLDELKNLDLVFPLILKPNFEGSSKGITQDSVVEDAGTLRDRLSGLLKRFPSGILVEEFIVGKDVTVPFIEGVSPATHGILAPAEYLFAPEAIKNYRYKIYDYDLKNKYGDSVNIRVPADLPPGVEKQLADYSRRAFQTLGIRDFGRIDYRVTPDGRIVFIEVNALPSLEPGAGLYLSAARVGLTSTASVLQAILDSAIKRYGLKPRKISQSLQRKLRVGFSFNVKRVVPDEDPQTDTEAEYDSPKTLDAIRTAIASLGHEVIDLEATPDILNRITVSDVDVVFNVAEGIKGRNRESQIPSILELLEIPYTGSDPATLAITLDKGLAKKIVRQEGIHTPSSTTLFTGKERLPKELQYPVILKPIAEGSSKGVLKTSLAHDEAQLREIARELITRYKQPALVEEYLSGREFTVALLGELRPRVLPPMEIVFCNRAETHPIYTYQHKLAATGEIRYDAPAKIDDELRKELERVAKKSFIALGCRDVARIDLRLDARGNVHFIECNPLPGLTPGWSDLCLIAQSAGMDYRTLISEILAPAVKRFKEKRKLLMQQEHPGPERPLE